MTSINVNMGDALRGMDVEVKVIRPVVFRLRFWIGMKLMHLGVWLAGFARIRAVDFKASEL